MVTGLIDATLGAVKIRFRPVIMTSLAFFFGVLPLAICHRRRRRGHERHRHRRLRRHALGHVHRSHFYSPVLCTCIQNILRRTKGATT